MEWYYADASRNQHRFQEDELAGLIHAGTIQPTTLIWNETMAGWQRASEVRPDLFPEQSGPPALTPAQRRAVAFPATDASPLPGQRAPVDPVAITSLSLAVASLLFCGPFLGIPAIICGHIGRKRAKAETLPSANGGLSLAGLIVGYLGVVVSTVVFLIYFGIIGMSLRDLDDATEAVPAPVEAEVMPAPEP